MSSLTTYTASEARKKLYSLIKKAGDGSQTIEIKLRGSDPVVLMSKEEFEGWIETLDIMSSPEEVKAIREAKADKRTISHTKLLHLIGIPDED